MNPNAHEFIPTLKLELTDQRKCERQYLLEQITSTKKELSTQNNSLILLHSELNNNYSILLCEMNRRESGEYQCYSKDEIDLLHTKYTQQSQYYYERYAKFNDLTSQLLTLQQRLHRLLLPVTPNSNNMTNNNNMNMNISNSISPEGENNNIIINNNWSPVSSHNTVLPPIMESDAESSQLWQDDTEIQCNEDINSTNSTTSMDNKSIANKQNDEIKEIEEDEISNKNMNININMNLNNLNNINNINNININPNAININAISHSFGQLQMHQRIHNTHNINFMNNSTIKPTAIAMKMRPNYIEFENKTNLMLDNIWNSDIKTICDQFNEYIFNYNKSHNYMNIKCTEILIDCIIKHAICIGQPAFFGSKYSQLTQSIVSFLSDNNKIKCDIYDLLWTQCYDTFRKLHFGNDVQKFVNICIVIAELFNANLLNTNHIFNFIFKEILQQNNENATPNNKEEICENDIEGIYEIFVRCYRSLNTRANKKYLKQYLVILNDIKTWNKFQNGMKRVPYMINDMENKIKTNKYK